MSEYQVTHGDVMRNEIVEAWQTGTCCGNPACLRPIPPGEMGWWIPTGCAGWEVLACAECAKSPSLVAAKWDDDGLTRSEQGKQKVLFGDRDG